MYHSFINLDIIDQIQLECYYHDKYFEILYPWDTYNLLT